MSEEVQNADVVTYDDGVKYVEFTVGKRRVKMRDLMGHEVRNLQKIGDGVSVATLGSDMSLTAIQEVDGVKLIPVKNDVHLMSRAQMFTSKEYFELASKYAEHFREDEKDPNSEPG